MSIDDTLCQIDKNTPWEFPKKLFLSTSQFTIDHKQHNFLFISYLKINIKVAHTTPETSYDYIHSQWGKYHHEGKCMWYQLTGEVLIVKLEEKKCHKHA